MTTMERLFIEIFDRKSRIERQLHRQFESYGESLALSVIADGGRPPPWLWERARGTAGHPDPGGWNKEQLISGIVFPVRMVNVSSVDPGTSFIMPETADGNACKPVKLFGEVPSLDEPAAVDLINTEDPKISKQNHNRAVDANAVEDCSELGELNRFSNSRSIQRDYESNLSQKTKTTHLQGEDRATNKKTGIKTRSRAASEKKVDCVDSLVANKCADTAKKSMNEKALVSEPHIKVSDCEYENSFPRRKKKYKSSTVIATSPRSRARSFLDIIQQNVCKYQTKSVSDSAVFQSSPKLPTIQIPTVQPPATEQNNKLHVLKDDSDFRSSIHDMVIAPNGVGKNKDLQIVEENLGVCSGNQVRPTNLMLSESKINHTTRDAENLFSYVDAFENIASGNLGHHDESKEPYDAPQCLYRSDITSISNTAGVNFNCDKTMPEFERFNIDLPYTLEDSIIYKDDDIPSIAKERAFVLEKLRLSSIMPTPSCKPSLMNKINIVPNCFHSSPPGMLENMDLGFSPEPNNPDIKHFTASSSIKLMDLCCNIGSQLDGRTLENSHSLSSSSAWFGSELENLSLTPSVQKFSLGRLSRKRSFSSATASGSIHLEDNEVTICPDTAKKSMTEKALVSEPHIKVSDCEYENSFPRQKKKYKSSNIIATSPRSRARSFLDINQQNVCKFQTECVSDSAVFQSSPKLPTIQIPTVQPPATEQNNKLHVLKDDSDFRSSIHDMVIAPNGVGKNKDLEIVEENLGVCSGHQVRPTNLMLSESKINHTTRDAESLFSYVDAFENIASGNLCHRDESKEPYDAPQCLSRSDITSISNTAGVNFNCDKTMPEFERFNIDLPYTLEDSIVYKDDDIPSIANERAFVLEKLRLSSIMPTPSCKPSLMNKINIVPNCFHSSLPGMLENMDLGCSLEPNNPDIKHFTASSSIKLMDLCCNIGSQLDGRTLENSHSLSSSSAWFGSELKNLSLTPPVQKFSHGRLSRKRSFSSATGSSIPELTCFRIDENSSTIEENDDFVLVEHSSSRNLEVSSNVEPLSDVAGLYLNNTSSHSNFREFMVRDSLESVNSDSTCSHGFDYVGRESKVENKENRRHTNDIKKPQKATGRLSKIQSRLSSKSSESYGNYQKISKGSKPANIISNISSFVPHIQQKQHGASRLQGMKDIKVKALEAAETAKRLENQKKLEREKKKAAAKLEREKIRQENAKLLKLKQKQKEEEKRKKEEYVAARKRQREEEERKIKERKRRCVEEARTLQRECEEKLHYEKDGKDFRQRAMDEKQNKRKQTSKGLTNLEKEECQIASEVQHHTIQYASGTTNLCDDKIQALGGSDEHNFEKGVACSNVSREANEEMLSAAQISPDLQSYDMSPYQNSDDEEREDSWHKKKYIPMWARRESLSEIILAIQHLDPKEIFSRKRSFDISQVLPAHALPRQPPLR
ncbi:hypothetical protein KSP39_PZI018151 [Platanthera zijinensis]|uniref:Inner centromere protein ARK-binding domain-containing protein n=1 Tax=Platanthera zijinensis TaxID=2320716 RepID=A0AAP0B425_9ASPA